jgi:hypothetical protein
VNEIPRSQWDSDFICPICASWLRPKGASSVGDNLRVSLRCRGCGEWFVIWITRADFYNESENGRRIDRYLVPFETQALARRKTEKTKSVGSSVFSAARMGSARRVRRRK